MIDVSSSLIQFGVLGLWTISLLVQQQTTSKIQRQERQETTKVIKEASINMALVNQTLKSMQAQMNKRGCV